MAVSSDHGVVAATHAWHVNETLRRAGLTRFAADGSMDLSGTSIAYHPARNGSLWVNDVGRPGGIVRPDDRADVIARAEATLRDAFEPETGRAPVRALLPADIADFGPRRWHPDWGDLFVVSGDGFDLRAGPSPSGCEIEPHGEGRRPRHAVGEVVAARHPRRGARDRRRPGAQRGRARRPVVAGPRGRAAAGAGVNGPVGAADTMRRNCEDFLATRGLTLADLHRIVTDHVEEAELVLLTSSPVHGLANRLSDIDTICITGTDVTTSRMATQLFVDGNHLETTTFLTAEVAHDLAALDALEAAPPRRASRRSEGGTACGRCGASTSNGW